MKAWHTCKNVLLTEMYLTFTPLRIFLATVYVTVLFLSPQRNFRSFPECGGAVVASGGFEKHRE